MAYMVPSWLQQKVVYLRDKIFGNDDEKIREITKDRLKHVVVYADAHRRWAKHNGLSNADAYRFGLEEVAPIVCKNLLDLGVHTVTIWFFQPDNLKRDKVDVDSYLKSSELMIKNFLPIACLLNVRMIHIGSRSNLPQSLLDAIDEAEMATKSFTTHIFNIAMNYSSKEEILYACNRLLSGNSRAGVSLMEEDFERELYTSQQPFPMPDLIIRPANTLRHSGFMMWQSSYSELCFVKECFPDLNKCILKKAILDFAKRKRNFGK